ncbi:MAG: TRAP transporter substrate-binding protein [Nitratireductor sp.]|nr:TRAP transporter substrate-binding protein [Nitratireductor sp.]
MTIQKPVSRGRGAVLALLAGLAGMAGFAGTARAQNWDMALGYEAEIYHSQIAADFARCVGDAGSSLAISTHPGGLLFRGADIKRAVSGGQALIGERLLSAHAEENAVYGIDSVPFLAGSFDEAEKLWAAAMPEVAAALARENLVPVYSVPWPPQGLYSRAPVNSASDLSGIKFRAYNDATARIAGLTGMVAVDMPAVELLPALGDGRVDAFMSSASTGAGRKVWTAVKNFTDLAAWLPRNVIFANKQAYDALSPAARQALTDCGARASAQGLAKVKEIAASDLAALGANGMTVARPSAQLRGELAAIGETMLDEWLARAGGAGQAIIEAYRNPAPAMENAAPAASRTGAGSGEPAQEGNGSADEPAPAPSGQAAQPADAASAQDATDGASEGQGTEPVLQQSDGNQ